jgi:hypothetical protein
MASPTLAAALCGFLLIVSVWACAAALLLRHSHDAALRDGERELQNTALILAEQTDRSFQSLDLAGG